MQALARQFQKEYYSTTDAPEEKPQGRNMPLFEAISESSLPDSEKGAERLGQEAFVVVSAGGETTSRTLSLAMFYIFSNTSVLDRLRTEILSVMPDMAEIPSVKEFEDLPYLVRCPQTPKYVLY